ncbi:MAG: hypothetical protein HQM08_31025 [Candidatus Riflebacteria bacterium]|nr:hypothetical protein [Candidatus Riflebacteria bacterium]
MKTGMFKKHNPKDKITKISNVQYDKTATCPTWNKFLEEVFEGKKGLINFVQKLVGHSLTGDVSEQIWVFLHGHGSNGKSTFIATIQKIIGDYSKKTDIQTFNEKDKESGGNSPEIAELPGVRFLFASETRQGKAFDTGKIKDMTGGETLRACAKYGHPFNFFPQFKIWISGNHKPIIKDSTYSSWRRICLIPFNRTFSKSDQDKKLPDKLNVEMSGILNWAIEGCLNWQKEGLEFPKEVLEATSEYQVSQDKLAPFITEKCITEKRQSILFKTLYYTYKLWCDNNNENPISKPAFMEAIQEREFKKRIGTGRVTFIDGINILQPILPSKD